MLRRQTFRVAEVRESCSMSRRWPKLLLAVAVGFVLVECKQAAPLRPQFAYVANSYSGLVSAYSIGTNGAMTPVPGSAFGDAGAVGQISVAVDSTSKFAYVANSASKNISGFSIESNGVLTPVPGFPFVAGYDPNSVAVDPTSRFVYVANRASSNVSAFSIGSDGALTPIPGSPFAEDTIPTQ